MRLLSALALPVFLFLAGCQLDPSNDNAGAAKGPVDPKKTEWEPLPEGRSFLHTADDSDGTPVYTPVKFVEDMAVIDGDIIIAKGDSALNALRAQLVDPRVEKPAALGKATGFVRNTAYTGNPNAWPNGVIPYFIGGGVSRQLIEEAVWEFNQGGGVTYVPYDSKYSSYVVFVPIAGTSSYSQVGMVNGPQVIQLSTNATRAAIMHEMCHAAGMYHEQSRPDRNSFVTVTTTGRDDSGWYNGGWSMPADGSTIGDYDYTSIMHYATGLYVFKYANGTTYKVNMVAKDGRFISNSTLSATDKLSLWGLGVSANPLRAVAVKVGLTGKLTKVFTTSANNVTKKWMCIYDPVSGNANILAMNADNTIGASVQNYNVGAGFNIIAPYKSSLTNYCMLFYSSSGPAKMYNLSAAAGTISSLISATIWTQGWVTIEHYQSDSKQLFFLQSGSYTTNICPITAAGTLGLPTLNQRWMFWVYAKPFYIETSPSVFTTYFVFRMNDGFTRIRQMPGDGTLGNTVVDLQLPNIPTVGVWQSVTKAYMALSTNALLYIYDMDNAGFRTAGGTAIFRVVNIGFGINRMDAANDLASINNSSAFINNKVWDFKHLLTWQRSDLLDATFTGWGAPFH